MPDFIRRIRAGLIVTTFVAASSFAAIVRGQTRPSTQPAAGIPPALRAEWERILTASREEEQRIRTLQVRYTWSHVYGSAQRIQGEDLQPFTASSTNRTMTYIQDGQKYFQDADMRHFDAGIEVPELRFHRIVGFDGTVHYQRRPLRKFAIVSLRPAVSVRPMPTPRNLAIPTPLNSVDEGIASARGKLDLIERDVIDGEETIRVQYSAGDPIEIIWLAPQRGWLGVRTRFYIRPGQLIRESTITETAWVRTSNGEEIVYPISAIQRHFDPNGNPADHMTLTVDRQSLKINEPIDPARFRIEPGPDERVSYETVPATAPATRSER